MGVAVGIDLGTTNSCVAVVQGEQARVVESVFGDRIHPSVISFHPTGEVLSGPRARDRLAIDPLNTIFSFKRLLGQDLNSYDIKKLLENLPFKVVEKNGIPVLETPNREATLPEVSAIMLRYLREMASETYGVDIKEAIITVPANFTDLQRSSTKIAGKIAGFNVLRILNEPTAAALAYGFGAEKEEKIAVYDLGGGTFDITIIELLDDVFEVLSTAGDNFLGGDDFDIKIAYDIKEQFKKQHGFDVGTDPLALQRIRSVAQRVKCQLSSTTEVNATLRELVSGKRGKKIDFAFSITRKRFEELIRPLVERTMATCEEALELAKITPAELDNIVLVGGSTRIPLVRQEVQAFFNKKPKAEVNPDEVVAIGAAINAFSLTGEALDPAIEPICRPYLAENQPFEEAHIKKDKAESSPMVDASGLAKKVRNSKIPPPFGVKKYAKNDDPFATKEPIFETEDDPFSDRKAKHSWDPEPILKIPLSSKKTMVGMGSDFIDLPGNVDESDLPALKKQDDLIDLPGNIDIDLPGLKSDWDLTDLPGKKESFDLPVLKEDISIDLPAKKFQKDITDLPGNSENSDLPTLKKDIPIVDLPQKLDKPGFMTPKEIIGLPGVQSNLPVLKGDGGISDLPQKAIGDGILPTKKAASFSNFQNIDEADTWIVPGNSKYDSIADEASELESTSQFEDLTEEIEDFEEIQPESETIEASNGYKEDMHELPAVLSPLSFSEKPLAWTRSNGFHPLDEVAGNGASTAEQTYENFVVPVKKTSPAVLLDVTPRGLGVATVGGYCDSIIERNAAIPIEQSRHFSTSRDLQTEVFIDVYQGESRRVEENTQLGRIELTNIRPASRGAISILVTFEIDTDGILNVKALNEDTGEAHSTSIKLSGGLQSDQIDALVEKYSKHAKRS